MSLADQNKQLTCAGCGKQFWPAARWQHSGCKQKAAPEPAIAPPAPLQLAAPALASPEPAEAATPTLIRARPKRRDPAKPHGNSAAAKTKARRQAAAVVGATARAEKLSPERRKEIAKTAANKRWGRK